jgi:hypothetical protein
METKFQKLKTTKERVILLLTKFPHLRDSDSRLVASYQWFEVGEFKIKNITGEEFLRLVAEEKITSADTILRARRKAQEQNEHLRGAAYYDRQLLKNKYAERIKDI